MVDNCVAWVVVPLFVLAVFATNAIHTVEEGHVGVYWRAGSLQDRQTDSGWHVKVPGLDTVEQIQVTMQTDSVIDVPCGTSGGVLISFDRIEVVNRLSRSHIHSTIKEFGVKYDKMWIFDKIHHEINQFCSKHSLREVFIDKFDSLDESLMAALQSDMDKYNVGVTIINVRVTKPRIPKQLRERFEAIEQEKASLSLRAEEQRVAEKEAETAANVQKIRARVQKEVREIELQKEILDKEGLRSIRAIESDIHLNDQKVRADAVAYAAGLQAAADRERLTPEYLQFAAVMAIANTSKIYFGNSIPQMLTENAAEGLMKFFGGGRN